MNEKLLTISVAAYNVEEYLENALNHIELQEWLDRLEVFIIDDGGSDNSLYIAQRYEEKYPKTFHAVHKENGGYGSTVAYSIDNATGKYFKILDGDDWFNEQGLRDVLSILETCTEDVIVTDYYRGPSPNNMSLISCKHIDKEIVDVKNYDPAVPHGMWALFYKTEVLKKTGIVFPSHTFYTDQLYATLPFANAKRILFIKTPVYCYRFGRSEQSTSRISRIKHFEEMLRVCDLLYGFFETNKRDNNQYLLSRTAQYYLGAVRTMLLFPVNTKNKKRIIEYERRNQQMHPEIYYAAEMKGTLFAKYISIMRKTGYKLYWVNILMPKKVIDF